MKQCKQCNRVLDISQFRKQRDTKDGMTSTCNDCYNTERRAVYKAKKDGTYVSKVGQPRLTQEERDQRKLEHREYNKQYRIKHLEKLKVHKQNYMSTLKIEGIAHYGGKCSCCGESIVEFLTIEHLNGRDKSEKKLTGKQMWRKAKSEGYPDTYTVLCFNCNCAKGAFGVCPHQM